MGATGEIPKASGSGAEMTSMVERVARAIADNTLGMSADYEYAARAAIAAMREPTEAMVAAGDIPEIVNCSGGCMAEGANPDLVWHAMIDEALK